MFHEATEESLIAEHDNDVIDLGYDYHPIVTGLPFDDEDCLLSNSSDKPKLRRAPLSSFHVGRRRRGRRVAAEVDDRADVRAEIRQVGRLYRVWDQRAQAVDEIGVLQCEQEAACCCIVQQQPAGCTPPVPCGCQGSGLGDTSLP